LEHFGDLFGGIKTGMCAMTVFCHLFDKRVSIYDMYGNGTAMKLFCCSEMEHVESGVMSNMQLFKKLNIPLSFRM
jgi:hypothetical protein